MKLHGLCHQCRFTEVVVLVNKMVAIVCELDVIIYISLIDGLYKMDDLDFSIELQILMVEKGMALDVFTYISLI